MNYLQSFQRKLGYSAAMRLLKHIAKQQAAHISDQHTMQGWKGKRIASSGNLRSNNVIVAWWSWKENILTVEYLDGRDAPKKKKESRYVMFWIEGMEKPEMPTVDGGYTTSKTKAMRVRLVDIPYAIKYLKSIGVAEWALRSPTLLIPTNYAPKGTLKTW